MTLGIAVLLLAVAVVGIVLVFRYLRKKPKLCIICLVLLFLIALVLVCYIGLTAVFIDAVRNQPPVGREECISAFLCNCFKYE